jgi:hypothetical protein
LVLAGASRAVDVIDGIDGLFATISSHQRELLRYVAEADKRGIWQNSGCRDMAQWLAGRHGISVWRARRWVECAHALERLPLLSEALEDGVLSLDKVVELARFATPDDEKKLINWARCVSPAAVRRKADLASRPSIDDAREAERARFLRWWWFDDGRRVGLEGEFPAAEGVAITKAIRRLADRLPDLPLDDEVLSSPEDLLEQRCADALYAMASHSISEDADADRATVIVRTRLDGSEADELEIGHALSPEVARMLKCDARLRFVLTDENDKAVGIGRASRDVPSWLMQELKHRDHGCTFPGCGSTTFLKAHHIRHWEDGGPTVLWNLVLVCHFHHKLVHLFDWKVRLNDSAVEWIRPDGRRYNPGPGPPLQLLA